MALYEIATNAGRLVTFETDLSVDKAYEIVASLPTTDFVSWILSGESHKQQMWALKVAQDSISEKAPDAVGPYLTLVSKVYEMQEKAKGKVILRFEGATVKAVTKGANVGSLYVFQGDTYKGKITPEGIFRGDSSVEEYLAAASNDPAAAAVSYGRNTGSCSCCGRVLNDPVSIFGGIGPVCLARIAGDGARADLEEAFRQHKAEALLDSLLAK